jgi:decaprenyl-phosphate phosphoribosyltransferase
MLILRLAALFVAISFAASSVYLVNDILDVEKDRLHPKKCHRPLAAGLVSISLAVRLTSVLTVVSLGVSVILGWKILVYMLTYIILTHCYSFRLKHIPYVEVLIVGGLFAIRVLVGFSAAAMQPAGWLLWVILTFFLATSMELGNRYSEMKTVDVSQTRKVLESYSDSRINRFWLAFSIAAICVYPFASWKVSPMFFVSTVIVVPMLYWFYRTVAGATEHVHPQDAIMQSRVLRAGIFCFGLIYFASIVR